MDRTPGGAGGSGFDAANPAAYGARRSNGVGHCELRRATEYVRQLGNGVTVADRRSTVVLIVHDSADVSGRRTQQPPRLDCQRARRLRVRFAAGSHTTLLQDQSEPTQPWELGQSRRHYNRIDPIVLRAAGAGGEDPTGPAAVDPVSAGFPGRRRPQGAARVGGVEVPLVDRVATIRTTSSALPLFAPTDGSRATSSIVSQPCI